MRQNCLRLLLSSLTLVLSSNLFGQGLEIYLVKAVPDLHESAKCHYCIDLTEEVLFENPRLEQSEIERFDWNNQMIMIKSEGKRKIEKLEIPLQGQAAAIVIDGKPVYGFWLWNV